MARHTYHHQSRRTAAYVGCMYSLHDVIGSNIQQRLCYRLVMPCATAALTRTYGLLTRIMTIRLLICEAGDSLTLKSVTKVGRCEVLTASDANRSTCEPGRIINNANIPFSSRITSNR